MFDLERLRAGHRQAGDDGALIIGKAPFAVEIHAQPIGVVETLIVDLKAVAEPGLRIKDLAAEAQPQTTAQTAVIRRDLADHPRGQRHLRKNRTGVLALLAAQPGEFDLGKEATTVVIG